LLLKEDIDFSKLKRSKKLDEIICIAKWIFKKEGIPYNHLKGKMIKSQYYYDRFKEAAIKAEEKEDKQIAKQIEFRSNLRKNESLEQIFAPAKMRIMEKIFNHERLTDTELKYYYRSIRPLIHSIMNSDMRDYLKIVETTKKLS
jgi:hypothetical protein